jgi:hypothetical protein
MVRSVPFKYFGKERNLFYDATAVKVIEKATEKGIFRLLKLMNEEPENISVDVVSIFLWSGLKHEDSTLTLSKVERWMTTHAQESEMGLLDTIKQYLEVIGDALVESGLMGKKPTEDVTENAVGDADEKNLEAEGVI